MRDIRVASVQFEHKAGDKKRDHGPDSEPAKEEKADAKQAQ